MTMKIVSAMIIFVASFAVAPHANARLFGAANGGEDEKDFGNEEVAAFYPHRALWFGDGDYEKSRAEKLACIYDRCCNDNHKANGCRCPARNKGWFDATFVSKCDRIEALVTAEGATCKE